jgi:hypothetical protein
MSTIRCFAFAELIQPLKNIAYHYQRDVRYAITLERIKAQPEGKFPICAYQGFGEATGLSFVET